MHLTLIRPPKLMIRGTATMKPAAPLGLAYIAGAAEAAGHKVTLIDGIANHLYEYYPTRLGKDIIIQGMTPTMIAGSIPANTEVIGLSCMFSNNWLLDRWLIAELRNAFPNALLIAGGESISGMPEYVLQDSELDVSIVGEGEETIKDLLDAYANHRPFTEVKGIVFKRKGEIITTPRRERIRQLDEIAFPAWHLFPLHQYFEHQITWTPTDRRSLPMLATRGCPYTCTFCSSPNMWTTKYSLRSPDNILKEMVFLYENYGVTNFELFDLTAIINRQWVLDFSRLLQNHPVKFTWQMPAGTRSEALSPEVIREMAKGGCTNITFAPESGSKAVLQLIRKKADPEKMLPAMKLASQLGMYVYINTIIGLPGETHRDVWRSIWYLLKAAGYGADDTGVGVFMPYPGSELFKQFKDKKQLDLNDEFFFDILRIDSFTQSRFFNKNISGFMYRFYNIFILLAFYAASFVIRPKRLFRSLKNVWTKQYTTRSEKTLGYFLEQLFSSRKKDASPQPALQQV